MKKPRVLRIIARLNVGGPARHVAWVSSQLIPNGFEHLLLHGEVGDDEEDMSWFSDALKVPRKLLSGLGREIRPLTDLKVILKIYLEMCSFQPDIVHTHTAKAGFCGRVAAIFYKFLKNPGLKIVHTYHGHVFHGYFSPLKTRFFLELEKLLARFSNAIVTISKLQQEEILNTYGVGRKERHHIIPLGLDTSFSQSLKPGFLRQKLGLSEDIPLIGCVGRLAPIKDHELFIETMAELQKLTDLPFATVILGSDRSERIREIRELARQKGLKHFFIVEDLTSSEEMYPDLNLMCLTSKNEGTPLTMLESMAAGTLVAGPRVGGIPDLLNEGKRGLLFSERKAGVMAREIHATLQNPSHQVQQDARKWVEKERSTEALGQNMRRLYANL